MAGAYLTGLLWGDKEEKASEPSPVIPVTGEAPPSALAQALERVETLKLDLEQARADLEEKKRTVEDLKSRCTAGEAEVASLSVQAGGRRRARRRRGRATRRRRKKGRGHGRRHSHRRG